MSAIASDTLVKGINNTRHNKFNKKVMIAMAIKVTSNCS